MTRWDPQRRFATVSCRIAKGSFDHLVGGGDTIELLFWGSGSLLLQVVEFFLQIGQARDLVAFGLVFERLFAHLLPARICVLLAPRAPGLGIEQPRRPSAFVSAIEV